MAKFTADQIRQKVLAILKDHPEGMLSNELQTTIFGGTNNEDEHRRRQQHLGFAMLSLRKAQRVRKEGRMGKFFLLAPGERPEPQVHDLPTNGKRGRPHGSKNGVANGDLRSYIIRDIRSKLAELEALS